MKQKIDVLTVIAAAFRSFVEFSTGAMYPVGNSKKGDLKWRK